MGIGAVALAACNRVEPCSCLQGDEVGSECGEVHDCGVFSASCAEGTEGPTCSLAFADVDALQCMLDRLVERMPASVMWGIDFDPSGGQSAMTIVAISTGDAIVARVEERDGCGDWRWRTTHDFPAEHDLAVCAAAQDVEAKYACVSPWLDRPATDATCDPVEHTGCP
jgi:hypothetical protein